MKKIINLLVIAIAIAGCIGCGQRAVSVNEISQNQLEAMAYKAANFKFGYLPNNTVVIRTPHFCNKKSEIYYWAYQCQKDKIRDTRYCFLRQREVVILPNFTRLYGSNSLMNFVISDNGNVSLFLVESSKIYPHTKQIIRIDNGDPIEFDVFLPDYAVKELRNSTFMVGRYVRWPENYNVDHEYCMEGFGEALDTVRRQLDLN